MVLGIESEKSDQRNVSSLVVGEIAAERHGGGGGGGDSSRRGG